MTYPSAQAQVTQKEEVRGSSEALPQGSAVWVAVYLPEAGRYYPEPAAAVSGNNGAWSSTTYIGAEGGDFGKHFDILATVADGTAQAAFTAYNDAGIKTGQWPGMADLAGAQIYDRVPVVRG